MVETLIVSGGNLDKSFALSYMKAHPCEQTIAVDFGMTFFYEQNWTPDYIVGDFDSVNKDILRSFQNKKGEQRPKILQFQPEKDETDTELAIRTAIQRGSSAIHILGATGSRMDHMIGNLHLLGMAMEHGVDCMMVDPFNRMRLIEQGITIKK